MAILLVASRPPPIAGQSLATEILVRALEKERIPHQVVDLSSELTKMGAMSVFRRLARVAVLPFAVLKAARKLKKSKIVFYLQLGLSPYGMVRDLPLLALARWRAWPTVLHVHGERFAQSLATAPKLVSGATRRNVARAARVILLSPRLADGFKEIAAVDRLVFIANGVDRSLAMEGARITPRKAPGSGLRVLYVGHLIPAKGYEAVLEAARMSHVQKLPHRFVLAGEETGATRVFPLAFARAHGLDNLEYIGPVSNGTKYNAFLDADILVLPSLSEGQPLVILEAFHFALPVIASYTGGIPDIVQDGINGLLIRPGSGEELLEAIERIATTPDLYETMSKASQKAAAAYTEELHGTAMTKLFREVLVG